VLLLKLMAFGFERTDEAIDRGSSNGFLGGLALCANVPVWFKPVFSLDVDLATRFGYIEPELFVSQGMKEFVNKAGEEVASSIRIFFEDPDGRSFHERGPGPWQRPEEW
jgi:hypothetical protein